MAEFFYTALKHKRVPPSCLNGRHHHRNGETIPAICTLLAPPDDGRLSNLDRYTYGLDLAFAGRGLQAVPHLAKAAAFGSPTVAKRAKEVLVMGDQRPSTSGGADRSPAISAIPIRSSLREPIFVRYCPILRRNVFRYNTTTNEHQRSALPNALNQRPNIPIIGPNHTITGPNTTVTGPNATITGPNTTITGPNPTGTRLNTTITGRNTTVTGPNTTITGPNTTITGPNTTITGPNTTITGPNPTGTWLNTTIMGRNTTVTGPNHTLTGPNTTVTGPITTITGPNPTGTRLNTTITGPNDTTSRGTASSSNSNLAATLRTYRKVPFDRVLHNQSYRIYSKTDFKKPQRYRVVLDSNDRTIKHVKKQSIQERSNQSLKTVIGTGRELESLMQKHMPSNLSGNSCPQKNVPRKLAVNTCRNSEDVIVGVDRVQNTSIEPQSSDLSPEITPAKRQERNISGIYPISTPKVAPQTPTTYEYVARCLDIRNRDESSSKINALVQKPLTEASNTKTIASIENYVQNIEKESNFDFIIDGDINNPAITFQETPMSYVGRYVDANDVNTYTVVQTDMTPTQNVDASYVYNNPVVQTAMTPTQTEYANCVNTYHVLQTAMTPTESVDASYVNIYPVVQTDMMATQNVDANYVNNPDMQTTMTPTQNTYMDCQRDMSSVVDTPVSMNSHQSTELENPIRTALGDDFNTTYRHKKIRSLQLRTRRESLNKQTSIRKKELPRIHEAISSFTNVPESISAQIANVDCLEVKNDHPRPDTSMLEKTVNKSQFLTHQPLEQTQTRTLSRCVFTTATSATATPWGASTNENDFHSSSPANELHMSNATTCALLAATGSPQNNDTGRQDALKWISQRRDNMERRELDCVIPCTLCTWTGPIDSLKYHISKEHLSTIHTFETRQWKVTFYLRALRTSGVWHSEIVMGNLQFYVLSAKAAHGTFRATLTTLSREPPLEQRGTFTVYNAVTGKRHSWSGIIPPLPCQLPRENAAANELTVALSELDGPRSECDKVTVFVKI